MNTKLWIVVICLIQLCFACQSESAQGTFEGPFFSLARFFEAEKQRLRQDPPAYEKTVHINGQTESFKPDSLALDNEFQVFVNAEINRPAWTDKYTIDSILLDNQLVGLNYKALTDQLKTRSIAIQLNNNQVSRIDIETGYTTLISNSAQQLTYEPSKGYRIYNKQQQVLSKDSTGVEVEVAFSY